MNARITPRDSDAFREEKLRIGGERLARERTLDVVNPYTRERVGTVPLASVEDVRRAYAIAQGYRAQLTRYERAAILQRAAALLRERTEEGSDLITRESGLCKKDSLYEIGRVADVLVFGANEALRDDGQVFSCDLTPHGKKRKVITLREPLQGVITAITPFNHPMNQVAHKIVPAVATNNRMVLKPSEKVPLSAYFLADILHEAGLPPEMLQVLTGDPREIADEMLTHPHVDLITFTGGVAIGKYIASKAGYRRIVLELGGNDPLIVMEDADLDKASDLAVQGSYKNSGQRCTAVKRILVQERVAARFTELVVEKTRAWKHGDPRQRHGHRHRRAGRAAFRGPGQRSGRAGRAPAERQPARRRALRAHRAGPGAARDDRGARGDLRPRLAHSHVPRHRRGDPPVQRHGLRSVIRRLHQPDGLCHPVCAGARGGHRERLGSAWLPH
jgi:putative phosphonoacetaldehyde dehydrogenase